jgi:hypothetical protein
MSGQYYLLAVLDDVSQKRLAALSDELTARGLDYTSYTPFHITLGYGVTPDEDTFSHIERVCAGNPSLDIALGYVGLFGLACLFLAPLPSADLLTLERELFGAVNDTPAGWVPHVTLRMGEDEYIGRAALSLAGIFEPFHARIEHLELYECGDGYANFVRRFDLSAATL